MSVTVQIRVQGTLVAEAKAENIMEASTKDYEVHAETFSSVDGSHGKHDFEIGDGRTRHDRNQTVWALVEKIAHTLSIRERQNVNKLPLAPGRKRIAIVFVNESLGDEAGLIATSVSEWTEVSAAEYDKLLNGRYDYRFNRVMGGREFRIIEQPIEQGPIIEKLFQTLREIEEEQADILRKAEAAAAERKQKAAARKTKKNEDKLRKLIEQDPEAARKILEGS